VGDLSRAKPRHRVGELSPRKQKQLVWYAKIDKAHPPALSLAVAVATANPPRKFVQRRSKTRTRGFIRILKSLSRTSLVENIAVYRLSIVRRYTVAVFPFPHPPSPTEAHGKREERMLDRHVAATINATTVWHVRSRVFGIWTPQTGLTGLKFFAVMIEVIRIKPEIGIHRLNVMELP
jgi:hypothetical protein